MVADHLTPWHSVHRKSILRLNNGECPRNQKSNMNMGEEKLNLSSAFTDQTKNAANASKNNTYLGIPFKFLHIYIRF